MEGLLMPLAKPLDPVALSALLASRLCHDLINPVGALGSGLDVLEDGDTEEGMRDAALDLIKSGGKKSIALLKFARLAYGAAGGYGAQIPMEEAEAAIREIYQWSKAELDWRVPAGMRPKDSVKVVLILAQAAMDCVPRGGTVVVSGVGEGFSIEATGARALLNADLVAALSGVLDELKPKFAPAYIAGLLARDGGGEILAALEGDKVSFRAKMSSDLKQAAAS
jgi:histidine phosphotransferase ChpT